MALIAARATLTVPRFSSRLPAERREIAAWLRSQADYLERANEFMPTLTLTLLGAPAPQADAGEGLSWHGRKSRSRRTLVCGHCGAPGHNRRTCPKK